MYSLFFTYNTSIFLLPHSGPVTVFSSVRFQQVVSYKYHIHYAINLYSLPSISHAIVLGVYLCSTRGLLIHNQLLTQVYELPSLFLFSSVTRNMHTMFIAYSNSPNSLLNSSLSSSSSIGLSATTTQHIYSCKYHILYSFRSDTPKADHNTYQKIQHTFFSKNAMDF